MDLRQLRYFLRVAETRSFTRAAELLRLAQPALGMQVRKLEEELGVQLLVRHARGVETTEAGDVLVARARELLRLADDTRQAIRDMAADPQGQVALGMTPSVAAALAAPLLIETRRSLPSVRLALAEEISAVLLDWVEAGDLSMSVVYAVRAAGQLVFEPLFDEDLYFITWPGGPDAGTGDIAFEAVVAHALLMPGLPFGLKRLLARRAEQAGLTLRIANEIRSVVTARDLVGARLGVTVLPLAACRAAVQENRLVARRIVDPVLSRTVYLARPAARPASRAEAALRDLLLGLIAAERASGQSGWQAATGVGLGDDDSA